MTINDGVIVKQTFTSSSLVANGCQNSTENSDYVSLTINGGEFIGGLITIKNDELGNLVINDGNFSNPLCCVENWNVAVIKGGKFEGATAVQNARLESERAIGNLEIIDGIFNGYVGKVTKPGYTKYASEDISITGGTFSTDVSAYCEDGYAAEKDATTGKYTVKKTLTWTTDKDSGYYEVDGKKYGMMRFMFNANFTGEVLESGIMYINAKNPESGLGNIVNTTDKSAVFQGDIINIPDTTPGSNRYYAKAYIKTADGDFWSEAVSCSVNWNKYFKDYKPTKTGGVE